jgi:hypothetical protein
MQSIRGIGFGAILVLSFSAGAQTQHVTPVAAVSASAPATTHAVSAHAAPRVAAVRVIARPVRSTVFTPNGIVVSTANDTFIDGLSLSQLLNGVPGLGFDYAHLAAINRNLAVMALIDPITQARLALAERILADESRVPSFFAIGGGGYYDPGYYAPPAPDPGPEPEAEATAAPAPQQQPIIIIQQPSGPQNSAGYAAPQEPSAEEAPAANGPDNSEFILVRRDGTQIVAGAFVRHDKQIVYVTPEGARRTMQFSDLDEDATILINQERGTSLQLPL